MKPKAQKIPEYLVYEIVDGKPIHYKGYKEVLKGAKQFDERIPMRGMGQVGSSYIQSLIITRLIILLGKNLSDNFEILSSEVGLKFGENSRRAADIAIFEKSELATIKNVNKYIEIPPKYVIEVDIKASKEDIENSTSYYHKKTDELLDFGVEYVFWVFTDSQKVMLAKKDSSAWKIFKWDTTFNDIENIEINIKELTK